MSRSATTEIPANAGSRALRRALSWLRSHPALVALAIELLVLLYILRPILWSSYSGDDVVISQAPMWRELTGKSLIADVADQNRYWMEVHGRFFPVSILQSQLIFGVLTSRLAYKIGQLVLIVLSWAALVLFVRVLTRSSRHATWVGAVVLFAFCFRDFHDPLLQFAAQQPFLVIVFYVALTLLALAARHRPDLRSRLLMLAGAAFWVVGLLTYETLYLLVPIPLLLVAILAKGATRKLGLMAIGIPTSVLFVFVGFLRLSASAPSTAYTTNLAPWRVIPALLKQTTGVFPFSYQLLAAESEGAPRLTSGWSLAGGWDMAALALLIALGLILYWQGGSRPLRRRERTILLTLGGLAFLAPSVVTSVTERWQVGELDWGQPYVSVYLSATGLAIMLLVAADGAVHWSKATSRTGWQRNVVVGGLLLLASSALLAGPLILADTNDWVVEQRSPLRTEREAFQAEIEAGRFDDVASGSTVIADDASNWFWVNGAFVAWYGGPEHLDFILPTDDRVGECGGSRQCYRYIPGDPGTVEAFEQ